MVPSGQMQRPCQETPHWLESSSAYTCSPPCPRSHHHWSGDHTLPLCQHCEAEQLTATNLRHSEPPLHTQTHKAAPGLGLLRLSPSEKEGARTNPPLGLTSPPVSAAEAKGERRRWGAESIAERVGYTWVLISALTPQVTSPFWAAASSATKGRNCS